MSLDLERFQKILNEDTVMRRVVVAFDGIGSGFGMTETDLMKKTGTEIQELRARLSRLQNLGALAVKCTQTGTSGPYDYFHRLLPGITVGISVAVSEQKG